MNKKIYCSECKREIKDGHSFFVNGLQVCYECLFGKVKPVMIYPIGKVNQVNSNGISRIDLFPYKQRFMYKLEEEKWITIVYYLHKVNSIDTVFKRGKESNGKEVGVFAFRSPYRSSRIAISDVELIRISNLSMYVNELDAHENSPVLDIKVAKKL
ncbi:MAG: TrmO family methyltransferase [Candidatus Caldatribacteriota bacterium]|nr:TrmO family methyltransferase [Candidatus Caldatribacteriota bacterium]